MPEQLRHEEWERVWHILCGNLARGKNVLHHAITHGYLPRRGEEQAIAELQIIVEKIFRLMNAPAP